MNKKEAPGRMSMGFVQQKGCSITCSPHFQCPSMLVVPVKFLSFSNSRLIVPQLLLLIADPDIHPVVMGFGIPFITLLSFLVFLGV